MPKLALTQVEAFVASIHDDDLSAVYETIEARIKTTEWPQIQCRYDESVTIGPDSFILKGCPHCDTPDSTFVEVDVCQRWNETDLSRVNVWGDGGIHVYTSGQSDFETLAYMCERCCGFVSLPGDNDVEWS